MSANVAARPLETEADYRQALAEIALLFEALPGSPEEDRLEMLGTLIEAYEKQHYPIDPPDPIAMLEHYLDRQGLEPNALEPFLGGPAEVEAILSRRQALTIDMIRRLHDGLGIPADILIQPYPLLQAA